MSEAWKSGHGIQGVVGTHTLRGWKIVIYTHKCLLFRWRHTVNRWQNQEEKPGLQTPESISPQQHPAYAHRVRPKVPDNRLKLLTKTGNRGGEKSRERLHLRKRKPNYLVFTSLKLISYLRARKLISFLSFFYSHEITLTSFWN